MLESDEYLNKDDVYFSGERRDIVDRLPSDTNQKILEIGCGDGATGSYAKSTGKCGQYIGVELFPMAADKARKILDIVHVEDIENFTPSYPNEYFDVLIASEVLEHLYEPWDVLNRLRPLLKQGAMVYASSPNIAHVSTLRMLLKNQWYLTDRGRMDRTHNRWFTPMTYAKMFDDCGYEVVAVQPVAPVRWKVKLFNSMTFSLFSHLFMSQVFVTAKVKPSGRS